MRRRVGLLPLPLLLLCCVSLATEDLRSETDYDGISKTTSPNEALRSMPKVPFETSVYDPSSSSVAADFPCPDAEAIAPCRCIVDINNKISLDCTRVESDEQLATVFLQDFPVKDLFRFQMDQNSAVTLFSSFMNGVTFESLYLYPGPFALEGISDNFLLDLKETLTDIYIRHSKLETDFFPFHLLPLMKLQVLQFHGSEMNWIPQIRTPNLTVFGVEEAKVEVLSQGTLPIGTAPITIFLYDNLIHTIEPGSIFFADPNLPDSKTITLLLSNNQLTTFDEAVFGDLMPYIDQLGLSGNPLTCGCDIAWLVLNETYLDVVSDEAKCANGTYLHDLDPQDFLDACRL